MATAKRMSRKELHEPDQVMSNLQHVYEWLRHYRWYLAIGAGLLLALLLGISGLSHYSQSKERAVAEDFARAYAPVLVPVGSAEEAADEAAAPAKKEGDLPASYPTAEEKQKVAAERLQGFVTAHAGTPLAALAALQLGAIAFEQKKWADAEAKMKEFLDKNPALGLDPIVIENLGLAALAQNKAAEAETWFKKLAESESAYFKALALRHLGDLYNPAQPGDAAVKGADKAKAQYEAAVAALKAADRKPQPLEEPLLEEIERKLALVGAVR